MRSVTCADCHNPHLTNRRPATAPDVSGMLQGVGGVDRNGTDVVNARYEYEVCFKCHGDFSQEIDFVPRVVNTTNLRLAFDPGNASYHPVVAMGKNLNVPSIPSEFEQSMNSSNIIYCTDCHADDEGGSKGPHGSNFPPILKMRYDVADNTVESYENYALCYRCHNRNSILSDNSFRKKAFSTTGTGGGHSGHLRAGIACAACHDPHGINPQGDSRESGSHTHLINFDTRVVQPVPGAKFPVYHESGQFSGTCTLQCHGVVHNNVSYP